MTTPVLCSLCKSPLQLSTLQSKKKVRCIDRGCSAYHVQINRDAYDKGIMDSFVKFWECYPKKAGKKDAIKAWLSLDATEEMSAEIVVSVVAHTFNSEQWIRSKQFIPLPATFIRGRKWEDEIIDKNICMHPLDSAPIREAPTKPVSKEGSKDVLSEVMRLTRQLMACKSAKEKEELKGKIKDLADKVSGT